MPSAIALAAYHEAGHAVMCQLMHLRIKSISIGIEGLDGRQTSHENPLRAAHGSTGDGTGTGLQAIARFPGFDWLYASDQPATVVTGTIEVLTEFRSTHRVAGIAQS